MQLSEAQPKFRTEAEVRAAMAVIRDYVRDKKPTSINDAIHMLNVIELIATDALNVVDYGI